MKFNTIFHSQSDQFDLKYTKNLVAPKDSEIGELTTSPKKGSLVVIVINESHYLAKLVDGDFKRNGRVSNVWDVRLVYTDGRLGQEIGYSYGNLYTYKGSVKLSKAL